MWLQEDNFINKLRAFKKKDWRRGVWLSGADRTLVAKGERNVKYGEGS